MQDQIYHCLNYTSVWLQCEQWEPHLAWQNYVMFQQSFPPKSHFHTVYIANPIYKSWVLEVFPDINACIL